MHFSKEDQLKQLESQIQKKHLLQHPFYLAWTKGELSSDCLKEYAMHYYHHVKAFPTYLSLVHAHTEDPSTRRHILNNLIDEEAGNPNHPELWRQFAISLGAKEEEFENHRPNREIQELITAFRMVCKEKDTAAGIAALYAYESQIPEICRSKIKGLKEHYGMTNPKDWAYFLVHITADEEHAAIEQQLLKKHLTKENAASVQESAALILEKLWDFLSGLCHQFGIVCAA